MEDDSPQEKIRQRAYELYVARGRHPGSEREDWLQAEREILVGERPLRATEDPRIGAGGLAFSRDRAADPCSTAGKAITPKGNGRREGAAGNEAPGGLSPQGDRDGGSEASPASGRRTKDASRRAPG